MARLNQNNDFSRFMTQYIAGLLAEQMQSCIELMDPARAQGAAMVLQQIQKDVEGSEEAFYKLTEQREIPLS